MNNSIISKFNGISDQYAKYRPSYSDDSIDYILKTAKNSVEYIVDIWAWTWKLTALFLSRWYKVVAIEPNQEMLNKLITEFSSNKNCKYIQAIAEKTTLPNASVDLVVVWQAFHRFDSHLFKDECKRILKKDWKVAILYNNWDRNDEIIKDIDWLSKKYCPLYKWSSWWLADNEKIFNDFFSNYEIKNFSNDYILTLESFLWLNFSASYAPKLWDSNYVIYKEELVKLFLKYACWDSVVMKNNTVLRIWKL